jgi:hypothetical protein
MGELLELGFAVAQSTVAEYLAKKGGSGVPWFLQQRADDMIERFMTLLPRKP